MKCPHCRVEIHAKEDRFAIGKDKDGGWGLIRILCPACGRFILGLGDCHLLERAPGDYEILMVHRWSLFRPKSSMRPPPPAEVPKELADDYTEACLVLTDSAKASAALSRRCLQHLLREAATVKHGDLFEEIQQVLDSGKLPTHIAESIDAVRNIGNFAAHPVKGKSTGEIVPVEPGEAEWNLDVLEALFDFYFVQPALLKKKRDALNKKLQDAGKKPMK